MGLLGLILQLSMPYWANGIGLMEMVQGALNTQGVRFCLEHVYNHPGSCYHTLESSF